VKKAEGNAKYTTDKAEKSRYRRRIEAAASRWSNLSSHANALPSEKQRL